MDTPKGESLISPSSRDDAMRKSGSAHNKSSSDMENHVYGKAKSRVSSGTVSVKMKKNEKC